MSKLRSFATPLTIGTFVIMGITGVLMFFHLNTGGNKVVHEFVGLLMVVAVLLHLVPNWRAFTCYFKRPVALAVMGISVVLLGLSFSTLSTSDRNGPGGRPDMVAIQIVTNAPLSVIAPLIESDTDTLISRLAAQGVTATADQTLHDLADGDIRQAITLLGIIGN